MKMILSDLDGTLLLPPHNTISPRMFEKIRCLSERDIRFVVASGRNVSELWHLFEPVIEKMCFVACDGALIYEGEKLIYAAPRIEVAQFKGVTPLLLQGQSITYVRGHSAFVREAKLHYRGHAVEFCENCEVAEPVYKAFVYDTTFRADGLNAVYADARHTEYTASGTDKGSATRFLLERYGVSPAEVIAFGDNINDIPMLSAVENRVAMRHAKAEVHKICNQIADNVMDLI